MSNNIPRLETEKPNQLVFQLITASNTLSFTKPLENEPYENYLKRQMHVISEALNANEYQEGNYDLVPELVEFPKNKIVFTDLDEETTVLRVPFLDTPDQEPYQFAYFAFQKTTFSELELELIQLAVIAMAGNLASYVFMKDLYEQQIKQINHYVQQITTRMQHFIKTPLSIMGTADYLATNALKRQNTEIAISQIQKIGVNVKLIDRIIESAAEYLKLLNGNIDSIKEEVKVELLKNSIKGLIESKYSQEKQSGQILLEMEADPSGVSTVIIDQPDVLKGINLIIDNALNFHPVDRENNVRIEVKEDSSNIVVTIQDNGIGMSEESLAKLYEPFFQVNTAGTLLKYGTGFGVGIKMAKILLETNNCNLNVESKPNEGTTVQITIPKK